jgi:hypothetical protein
MPLVILLVVSTQAQTHQEARSKRQPCPLKHTQGQEDPTARAKFSDHIEQKEATVQIQKYLWSQVLVH